MGKRFGRAREVDGSSESSDESADPESLVILNSGGFVFSPGGLSHREGQRQAVTSHQDSSFEGFKRMEGGVASAQRTGLVVQAGRQRGERNGTERGRGCSQGTGGFRGTEKSENWRELDREDVAIQLQTVRQ